MPVRQSYPNVRRGAAVRALLPLVALFVAIGLSYTSQAAAQTPVACEDSPNNFDCPWVARGQPKIDFSVQENNQVIRILGIVALRYEKSVMVEFRRDKFGQSWLTMFDPLSPDRNLVVPIEDAAWFNTLSRWKNFAATQAEFDRQKATHEKKQQEEEKKKGFRTVVVCADGSDVEIDTALDGRVAHLSASDCLNDEVDIYLNDVRALAYSLIPYCADLIAKASSICLALDGDKFAAAEVLNLATSVKLSGCDESGPSASLLPLLAPDAILRVNGGADIKGPTAVARAWESFACQAVMYETAPKIVEARGQYARMVGSLVTERPEKLQQSNLSNPKFFDAVSVEQWKRNDKGRFELTSWEIGPFVQQEDQ